MRLEHWTSDVSDTVFETEYPPNEVRHPSSEVNARLCCFIEDELSSKCINMYREHVGLEQDNSPSSYVIPGATMRDERGEFRILEKVYAIGGGGPILPRKIFKPEYVEQNQTSDENYCCDWCMGDNYEDDEDE